METSQMDDVVKVNSAEGASPPIELKNLLLAVLNGLSAIDPYALGKVLLHAFKTNKEEEELPEDLLTRDKEGKTVSLLGILNTYLGRAGDPDAVAVRTMNSCIVGVETLSSLEADVDKAMMHDTLSLIVDSYEDLANAFPDLVGRPDRFEVIADRYYEAAKAALAKPYPVIGVTEKV